MIDYVHVYIDNEKVIQEIEFTNITTFNQYEHIIISSNEAEEVYNLYRKWEQYASIKNNKFMLLEIDGTYRVKKAVYIYYHFKDKSIYSITPRQQETLDDDGDLRSGLVAVDELLEECINGTKSMINCRANTEGDILVFEEIPVVKLEFDVASSITLIADYEIKEINDNAIIDIIYNGNELLINRINKGAINKKYELFFLNRFDKTIFYDSVFFMFTEDQEELLMPLTLDDNYMVISLYRNIMTFTEV